MDLMAQRYADPYLILDDFIRLGQLHNFSIEAMRMIAEEKVNENRWQYYLHRVWNMSFEEYVSACEKKEPEMSVMQKEEALQIIQNSNSILDGFTL